MTILQKLCKKGLAKPPAFLADNCHYLAISGSEAYGCNEPGSSDIDVQGWCIPPKDVVFPHLAGEIPNFGAQKKRFDTWQQHHITDPDDNRQYDFAVYNVVSFFNLCMTNNPNMIDLLFVPEHCVMQITRLGQRVRENRKLFLHKGAWHKFKGYAYSQLHKIESHRPAEGTKRAEMVSKFGYDVKFAYHVVRLMLEVEQILESGDLDLQRDREIYKSIRRGEWEIKKIKEFFSTKEAHLEALYASPGCPLPYGPNEPAIKQLLLNVLEEHYGTISQIVLPGEDRNALLRIKKLLEEVGIY